MVQHFWRRFGHCHINAYLLQITWQQIWLANMYASRPAKGVETFVDMPNNATHPHKPPTSLGHMPWAVGMQCKAVPWWTWADLPKSARGLPLQVVLGAPQPNKWL